MGTKITLAANCRRAPVGDEIIIDIARGEVFRWGRSVLLSVQRMRILLAFLTVPGRTINADDLAESLWFDDPRGGPESYMQVVQAQTHTTRYAIAPLGLIIATHMGFRKFMIVLSHPAAESDIAGLLLKSMRRKKAA